jgi:hypothetical protein
MHYTCPVCGFSKLRRPPTEFLICPSCGTEFEYTDSLLSHAELRENWIAHGAEWSSQVDAPPQYWNAWQQLIDAGFSASVPKFVKDLRMEANEIVQSSGTRNIRQETFEVVAAV